MRKDNTRTIPCKDHPQPDASVCDPQTLHSEALPAPLTSEQRAADAQARDQGFVDAEHWFWARARRLFGGA